MLARTIEAAGISTVLVTMMPLWAEKYGVPRALGVEFPFGHPLGHAGRPDEQLAVIRRALALLRDATTPGVVEHYDQPWDGDFDEWRKRWHPSVASPAVQFMLDRAKENAEKRRAEEEQGS